MSASGPLLDRAAMLDAFRRLGDRLQRRGVIADIYVIGGAAMAVAYDARRATRDIDAVFHPHGIVREEACGVAAELGLPDWWLNEQAGVYVAPGGDPNARHRFWRGTWGRWGRWGYRGEHGHSYVSQRPVEVTALGQGSCAVPCAGGAR